VSYTIGLDIHKRETEACIMDGSGVVVARKRFRTRRASFRQALRGVEGDAIIESVGFHRPVAKWLQEQGHAVHVAHVGDQKKPRIKSDRRDAENLARRFQLRALTIAYLPPEEIQLVRDLARHRRLLGENQARWKNKIAHDLQKHGHLWDNNPVETQLGRAKLRKLAIPEILSSLTILETIEQETAHYQKKLDAYEATNPTAKRLATVPGIGAYTATLIAAEAGDWTRFQTKEGIGAYAGLVPRRHQSGDHDRHGHITKNGNETLRWALVEAARNHVIHCPDSTITKRYQRLLETKPRHIALIATARHLGGVLWAMITTEHDFQVTPPSSGDSTAQ
jgi:transposase